MLDYARQRAREALSTPQTAVLATSGPAGVQAGEFPCEAIGLELFLLVPQTSDHLFNLEHDSSVSLLTAGWEMKGNAQVIASEAYDLKLGLLQDPSAKWCALVRVEPGMLQIRGKKGWGNLETIDLKTTYSD
ncbi:MAG: pyridoxamine 5'-phosphate oxidase family protein [Chloroflexi bacterium]|nr:pyridoxamine 5'-phosphate oxidase family protein [Chloroflexota bacterium]